MELPSNMVDTLLKFGVGKRTPHDDFFKSNETLSEMHMRLSVFDIDVGKIGDGYESFKCHVPGCSTEFNSLMEFESHYNSGFFFKLLLYEICNHLKYSLILVTFSS